MASGLVALLVVGPAAWWTTDVLEQNNDFCNACHISGGVFLHAAIRTDFDARPPASLAGAHGAEALKCIDCHGGTGWIGRARVKALAAKDTLVWLVAPVEEPTHMEWPLLDADCRKCHDEFAEESNYSGTPTFHQLSVHNVELGVDCVACHLSHEKSVTVGSHFLDSVTVRGQCALCHVEYADAVTLREGFSVHGPTVGVVMREERAVGQ